MSVFKHQCGETNHDFEPRYSVYMPKNGFTAERCTLEMMEAIKDRVYMGDVCRYCGKIVNQGASDRP